MTTTAYKLPPSRYQVKGSSRKKCQTFYASIGQNHNQNQQVFCEKTNHGHDFLADFRHNEFGK